MPTRSSPAGETSAEMEDLHQQLEVLREQLESAFDDVDARIAAADQRAAAADTRAQIASARAANILYAVDDLAHELKGIGESDGLQPATAHQRHHRPSPPRDSLASRVTVRVGTPRVPSGSRSISR